MRATAVITAAVLLPLAGTAVAADDLLQVYDRARSADTELQSARAEAGAADARYRQARGQLLPNISGSASYSQVSQEQRFEGTDGADAGFGGGGGNDDFQEQQSLALSLNQPLFDWAAWQSKDAAAARGDAAERDLAAAEQSLMVRTAQAYFDVLAARDDLEAAQRQQEVIARQLDRADAAFESGLSPVTERQEAQSELDGARVDAITARNGLNRARDALRQLTGQAPAGLAPLADTGPASAPEADVETWLARAQSRSPAVAAARRAYAAAREDVDSQQGGHLPTVSLVGRIGESEQVVNFPVGGTSGEFDSITETRSVGIELSLPIFSGGATSAAVDEARYQLEQARQDLIAARRQVTVDVRTAYDDVTAAAARIEALDAAIASGETAVEAARAGRQTGTRNILDVLEAEIELVRRRADRQQAWYDFFGAKLRLRQAAGILGRDDLERVNARLAKADTATGQE
ncbi:TolC family outer membrane protein [Salinisphaera sp. P385]|uniref:TolC family outer membrane protein n=1 Tax=Spectribacter acetivorans TaxID=3075603 RepID=A0ABU3B3Z8_9GAMM|nr:TolC family outer membrane protein [Salinisphaera sp. P385]MDT0617184.1 TolC family outer membrane protein [Salinisphaera sp. P385]